MIVFLQILGKERIREKEREREEDNHNKKGSLLASIARR
jgi:hypothetical protein